MEEASRLKKSVLNAQVNFFFFLAMLLLSFFSIKQSFQMEPSILLFCYLP